MSIAVHLYRISTEKIHMFRMFFFCVCHITFLCAKNDFEITWNNVHHIKEILHSLLVHMHVCLLVCVHHMKYKYFTVCLSMCVFVCLFVFRSCCILDSRFVIPIKKHCFKPHAFWNKNLRGINRLQ